MNTIDTVKKIYEIIKPTYFDKRNDLLDNLTIIAKLAIFKYKPIGCKISIHSNKLIIQDISLFQGTIRTLYGDKKTDINILYSPIIFSCLFYLQNHILEEKYTNSINDVFKMASDGLLKLKETYIGSDIVYNIDQLKNMIDCFMLNPNVDMKSIINTKNLSAFQIKQSIYSHINKIWTENRLNILFGLINELKHSENEHHTNYLVNSLTSYLDFIDSNVIDLINNL